MDKLKFFVVYHDKKWLDKIAPKPHLVKVPLNELNIGEFQINSLCENRFYLSNLWEQYSSEYIGLGTARWEDKYNNIYPLTRLLELESRFASHVVLVAQKCPSNWIEKSEQNHPGMKFLINEILSFANYTPSGESFWANNFICHRDVFLDFIQEWKYIFSYFYKKYGLKPPFKNKYSKYIPSVHCAYYYERITTAYFASQKHLKIIPIGTKLQGKIFN